MMEAAVLKGQIKQGGIVEGRKDYDVTYIQAVKMIVDKSYLFGFLGSTDVVIDDIILTYCCFCGKKL